MKRWIIYIAVLAGAGFFGASAFHGTDIAELAPVEVVWLSDNGGQVYLHTDSDNIGWGENVTAALADMKAAAPGSIFLETADYLIVEVGAEELLAQVYDILRPSCKICVAQGMPDLKAAAAFLDAHEPAVTLRQRQAGRNDLPLLSEQAGRFEWIEQ